MSTNGKQGKKSNGNAQSESEKARYSAEFVGYVNYQPTDEDKEAFVAYDMDAHFWDVLEDNLLRGRKVAITRDLFNGGAIATIMERDTQSVNAGLVASCRGKTGYIAMARLLWLTSAVFHDDWRKSARVKTEDNW